MRKLLLQILAGILGLWLASYFVSGVEFESWKTLLLAGFILGLLNFFIKPVLNLIALPLRMFSLGLFSSVINMGLIQLVDVFFTELIIEGFIPLFWTTLIIWGLAFVLPFFFPKRKPKLIS